MSARDIIFWAMGGAALALLGGLFLLYRNPLFQIYLSNWGLC